MKTTKYIDADFKDAMRFLIAEYGLYSDAVDTFYNLGQTDEAIEYAVQHGYVTYEY